MHASDSTSAQEINEVLKGFTNVVQLSLTLSGNMDHYDLTILLAEDTGGTLHLSCKDVSNLQISEFGGGLTQLLALRCDDVRAQQHDRVTLHFADVERDSLNFDCFSAEASPVQI